MQAVALLINEYVFFKTYHLKRIISGLLVETSAQNFYRSFVYLFVLQNSKDQIKTM